LCLRDERGVLRLDHVGFQLRAGEIVGVAGVSGNGQSELLEVLSGIRAPQAGSFTLDDHEVTGQRPSDPAALRAWGLAHVPEDRQRLGMVSNFAASESAVLGYQRDPAYAGRLLLDAGAIERHCGALM